MAKIWTDEERALIVKLRAEGHTLLQMSQRFGVTRNAMAGLTSRMTARGELSRVKPSDPRRHLGAAALGAKKKPKAQRVGYLQLKQRTIMRRPAKAPPPPPKGSEVRFADRRSDQCAYILGDPYGPDTVCCGAPVGVGYKGRATVYCQHHHYACTNGEIVITSRPNYVPRGATIRAN